MEAATKILDDLYVEDVLKRLGRQTMKDLYAEWARGHEIDGYGDYQKHRVQPSVNRLIENGSVRRDWLENGVPFYEHT